MRKTFFVWGMLMFSTLVFSAEEAEYYFSEANKYLAAGQTKEAATYFEHSVHGNADFFYLIQENGTLEKLLQSASKDVAETVDRMCAEARKQSKTEDPFVLYYSGWARWVLGKKDEAKKELNQARQELKKQGVDSILVDELLKKLEGPAPAAPTTSGEPSQSQSSSAEKEKPHKTGSVGSKI